MSEETWLTTAQAAQALNLSQRQVTRYCEAGRLRTRKAGRRILVSAADVAALADELAVDIPRGGPPARRSELPVEVVRYLQDQTAAQRDALDRLQRIEERLSAPPPPPPPPEPFPWLRIALVATAAAALVAIVVILAATLL
ncbi:MAG: Helix-turn-helix domain [Chloroflexota bacterium]|jgi:excisionase family DNA binding protein